jgi:ribosomal protein L7/L12
MINKDNIKAFRAFRRLDECELIDLLYLMAEAHPETFIKLLTSKEPVILRVPGSNEFITLSQEEFNELRTYTRDKKISCIKRIREITHVGLKEAKDISEEYFGMRYPTEY